MYKIIVWGTGYFYAKTIAPVLQYEKLLGNISVICLTGKNVSKSQSFMSHEPLLPKEKALSCEYDYIIIASATFEQEIFKELIEDWKVHTDKIIFGNVFRFPYFNFMKYCKLKETKISIIAESCYGAYIYRLLKLQYNSPFIAMRIESDNYMQFLRKPFDYLKQKPMIIDDRRNNTSKNLQDRALYPKLSLNKEIVFHCFHNKSEEEALNNWTRRITRINWNKLLFMMVLDSEQLIEEFIKIQGIPKLGFCYREVEESKDIISFPQYAEEDWKYSYDFRGYIHQTVYKIDLITLLLDAVDKETH